MVWGDVATWIGAIAAVSAAVVAIVQTRKAGQAAQAAGAAETRAVDAAERSATAADRSAEAQSRLATLAEVDAQKPPWALQHRAGDTYEVINDGPTPKFGVRVEGEPIARLANRNSATVVDRLEAGSSLGFWALVTMETRSTQITVRWRDTEEGVEREWSRELPSRPPRGRS